MSENITAFCYIQVKPTTGHDSLEDFLDIIRKFPQIKRYSVVTGESDGILEIEVEKISQIYDLFVELEKIESILATKTHIVVKEFNFD